VARRASHGDAAPSAKQRNAATAQLAPIRRAKIAAVKSVNI
jgi:hypothetical protein